MKKGVILLSGGLDSAVCAALAVEEGYRIFTITFDYGQKNRQEIKAARRVSDTLGACGHKLFNLDLGQIGGSALTDSSIDVPLREGSGIPVTYVPARNLIFLSVALSWAEVLGAEALFIGANVRDYSGYPDCRKEFLKSFEKTAGLGTKDETRVKIKAPLLFLKKKEIVSEGNRLGLDLSITTSCYRPLPDGGPCGLCDSCRIRKEAVKKFSGEKNE